MINQAEVQQWLVDALKEALEYNEHEEVEKSVAAWKRGYSHFEEQLEPALRYYDVDSNRVTELEFLIGRIGAEARAGNPIAMASKMTEFNEKMEQQLPLIPSPPTTTLTH